MVTGTAAYGILRAPPLSISAAAAAAADQGSGLCAMEWNEWDGDGTGAPEGGEQSDGTGRDWTGQEGMERVGEPAKEGARGFI